jgi:hypothetical protein
MQTFQKGREVVFGKVVSAAFVALSHLSMRKAGMVGEVQEWRDLASTRGQRYWFEVCNREKNIRGAWQKAYDERKRRAEVVSRVPGTSSELPSARSSVRRGDRAADRTQSATPQPHRFGAMRELAPLSRYEASLRDRLPTTRPRAVEEARQGHGKDSDSGSGASACPHPDSRLELRMSTMPLVGDMARPSLHHAASLEALRSQEARFVEGAPFLPNTRTGSTPATPAHGGSERSSSSTEYERSRALRRARRSAAIGGGGSTFAASTGQLSKVTAMERRQKLFDGAAGKPHPRDFAGQMPAPFDRRASAPTGYRPTEADLAKQQGSRERANARLGAQLASRLNLLEIAERS